MILNKICSPQAMAFYLSRNTNLMREMDANIYPLYGELDAQSIPLETAREEVFLLKTSAVILSIRYSNKSAKKRALMEDEYKKAVAGMYKGFFGHDSAHFGNRQDECMDHFSNGTDGMSDGSDGSIASTSFLQGTRMKGSANVRQLTSALFKMKHDYNLQYINRKWLK